MTRVAIASFEFEGNNFSPKVSGPVEFSVYGEGEAIWPLINGNSLAITGGIDVLKACEDIQLFPVLIAQGGSGGEVEPRFYRQTVDKIVNGIRDNGPFDAIYLALHGAMISASVPDGEGTLLEELRAAIGPAPKIAVSLDLHANVTQKMVEHADVLVGYENYPHDDAYNTGKRACDLLVRSIHGELTPVMRMVHMNMLVPVPGGSTLGTAPLAKVKALARSLESGAVVSTSYFTCQPWLDDDQAGNVVLAITNGDPTLADSTAKKIAAKLWELRDEFVLPLLSVEEAISAALEAEIKPAILADTGDSVGAGATGDSAFVLAALLKHARGKTCAVSLVDPVAVERATASGAGSVIRLDLGHSLDSRQGAPLSIDTKVVSVHDGKFRYKAGPFAGVTGEMGPTVRLDIEGMQVLVATHGTYEYADEQFVAVGINPSTCDIIVLKNGMNFRNLLTADSSYYLVDSIGSSSANLAQLPWKNRKTPFWPREEDLATPFAG